MITESQIRGEIAEIGRRVAEKNYIAATDGNISYRFNNKKIMITPSGVSKGDLDPRDMLIVDIDGKLIKGKSKPSAELLMHLLIYQKRDDVNAIVHAHPPTAVALSIAGVSMAHCVIPEVVLTMGSIPTAPYATPTTQELPDSIEDIITETDVIILERHGSVTIGKTLEEAFFKLDKLEHASHITLMAKQVGGIKPLSKEEVDKLVALREKLGIKNRARICENCGACPNGTLYTGDDSNIDKDKLIRVVTEEVLNQIS